MKYISTGGQPKKEGKRAVDKTDLFTYSITHSKEQSEQFTLEVEEGASIREESGQEEGEAFREAAKEITQKYDEISTQDLEASILRQ